MATTLSRPYGILVPIERGSSGYFNQSYDILEQMRSNLTTLLKTRPGERRMNPSFGTGLYAVLFEFNSEELVPIVTNIIKNDVAKFLPQIVVLAVNVDTSTQQRNIYTVSVSVTFAVNGVLNPGNQTVNLSFSQPIA